MMGRAGLALGASSLAGAQASVGHAPERGDTSERTMWGQRSLYPHEISLPAFVGRTQVRLPQSLGDLSPRGHFFAFVPPDRYPC